MTQNKHDNTVHSHGSSDALDEHGHIRVSNAIVLNGWQWIIVLALVAAAMLAAPRVWRRVEPLEPGPAQRQPFELSEDTGHYGRLVRTQLAHYPVAVVGDSVVWGISVPPEQALPMQVNRELGREVFANLGINGQHPAALRHLVKHHLPGIEGRPVLLHVNLQWTCEPVRDLSASPPGHEADELKINHRDQVVTTWPGVRWARRDMGRFTIFTDPPPEKIPPIDDGVRRIGRRTLVELDPSLPGPTWTDGVPLWDPEFNTVAGWLLDRHVPYYDWTTHLKMVYFEGRSIESWMLANPEANPVGQFHVRTDRWDESSPRRWFFARPTEFEPDRPDTPWTGRGIEIEDFPWIPLEQSFQWRCTRHMIETLRARSGQLLVVIGPYNEHLLTEASRQRYRRRLHQARTWIEAQGIPCVVPEVLPSELYADASHPLAKGYRLLAQRLLADETFRRWVDGIEEKDRVDE